MRNSTIRVATFAGPGAAPVIRSVEWPHIPKEAALIAIGACGVCGTDLHILKGHWPKPLPWPFTLGHELGGIIVEAGAEFTEDFMGKPLRVGSKVMIPPLMPCGRCYYCVHYPERANKCLTPVYYGRYLGFDAPSQRVTIAASPQAHRDQSFAATRSTGKVPAPARVFRRHEPARSGNANQLVAQTPGSCKDSVRNPGWGFTGNGLPLGVDMLYRARDKYPWLEMQTLYPFDEDGISRAVKDAMAMKTVKSTIVPWPELV